MPDSAKAHAKEIADQIEARATAEYKVLTRKLKLYQKDNRRVPSDWFGEKMQSLVPEVNKLSTIPQGLPFAVQLIIRLGEYSFPEIEGFAVLNDWVSPKPPVINRKFGIMILDETLLRYLRISQLHRKKWDTLDVAFLRAQFDRVTGTAESLGRHCNPFIDHFGITGYFMMSLPEMEKMLSPKDLTQE
jgi:hypothetical protein